MSINSLKGFSPVEGFKPVISQEKPETVNKKAVDDTVLDLNSADIQNELLHQDVSKVTAVQIGSHLITGLGKEDVIKLIEILKKECLEPDKDKKGAFKLKETFKMVNFSQETGITVTHSDYSSKSEDKTMAERAKERLGIGSEQQVKEIIGADLKLIGRKFASSNDVGGKILLQDMALLESRGLLTAADKTTYQDVLTKFGEDYKSRHGAATVSPANFEKLKKIAEKYMESSDNKGVFVDPGQLAKLGSKDGGSISEQYDIAAKNKPAIIASSQAAIDDSIMAVRETGSGSGVATGRTFTRMKGAIDEMGKQFNIINDQLLPAVSAQIKDLNAQLDKRVMELVNADPKYKNLKDPKEIKEAIGKDPALAARLNTDPVLMKLNAQLREAGGSFEELSNQALKVGNARVKALEGYKTVNTIHQEEEKRTGAAQVMTARLALGENSLREIQSEVDTLNLMSMEVPDKQILLDGYKARMEHVKANLVQGMQELINTYEGTETKNPGAVKLLKAQLDSLKALNTSDPKVAIETLEAARKGFIGALEKACPAFISTNELKALKALDKNLTSFTGTAVKLDDGILMTNQMVKLQVEEITHRNDEVSKNSIAQITNLEGDGPESRWGLTYGSHVGFSFDFGAGVGIGTANTFEAKAAFTVGTAATVEKSFGKGPTYLAHIDWNVKVEGNVTIADIVDLRASYKMGGTYKALGFSKTEEAQEYFSKLGQVIKLYSMAAVPTNDSATKAQYEKEYQAAKAELDGLTKKYVYDSSFTEKEVTAAAGKDGNGAAYKYLTNTTTTTLPDGTKIEDVSSKHSVKAGKYEISISMQKSSQPGADNKDIVSGSPDSRTVLNVAIPAEVIKKAVEAGSFSKLPKELISGLAQEYANVTGVVTSAETLLPLLDKALAGMQKLNPLGLARLMKIINEAPPATPSSSMNVNLGLEFLTTHDKDKSGAPVEKTSVALQLGLDASASYRRDFPFSIGPVPAFARVSGKAEFEAGVFFRFYRDEKPLIQAETK